ncbi:MAG TPA: demethoxyubiquinone hydroxylase family protein [Azospirillaceae bacterium]|nr:demethoxyubiquinone hydroxylase family protein [Azospirillaceae bacterium]
MDAVPPPAPSPGRSPYDAAPAEAARVPPPVLDWAALPPVLRRELRASHLGEAVAVRLYDGVADATDDPDARRFARHHREVEEIHLARLRRLVPAGGESRLLAPCRAGGWLMGWLPAKVGGPRTFYAVLAAVEGWVDGHYAGQIALARRLGAPPGLVELLEACRSDESHHAGDAARLAGRPGPLARLLAAVAVACSRAGVALARRL